ncbi:hypothetical protein Palpr_2232 [Paludibacter propionicigenes WB4]|uniref:Uncharacterized protein n=1 Tax=Paludibacter propionicigenes (strain DSM 17365 / JCM 13257 / WB4) TaxID=694427 RepID=E4T6M4_PALPW|nr:hypothetical protein [Paludibacter propionicigenes]ADQ80368.1 hypothetical protein Palpr_2232 [Paludibacter propionicigenes WB4]
METKTTATTDEKKVSKSHYETIDEKITKMKVTFDNATLPEIFTVMVTVGYTAEKIDGMKNSLNDLILLNANQVKESAEQSAEQTKFDNKRKEINTLFNTHRGMLRIFFKGNDPAYKTLQLNVENPTAYGNWNQLVTRFYVQLAKPDMLEQTSAVAITQQVVNAQQQALTELNALKDSIIKESGDAVGATHARDVAYDELYPLYSDYVKYAKLLLPDASLLKMLGVTTK